MHPKPQNPKTPKSNHLFVISNQFRLLFKLKLNNSKFQIAHDIFKQKMQQRSQFQRIEPESIASSTCNIRLRNPTHLATSSSMQENVYQNHDNFPGGNLEPRTLVTEEYTHSSAEIKKMLDATYGRDKMSSQNQIDCVMTQQQINLVRDLVNNEKFSILAEEQRLQQQAEQLQQQVPLTHVSIGTNGTNDESSGIFEYYRRSVSECGNANGSTSQQHNKSSGVPAGPTSSARPYTYQPTANSGGGHKESSFISVPLYHNASIKTNQNQNTGNNIIGHQHQRQHASSTIPVHEKNSLCDTSALNMFESTLLAEKNAAIESLSQTQPTVENSQERYGGHSRLSNYNGAGGPPQHSDGQNVQAAANNFHNVYANLNFNNDNNGNQNQMQIQQQQQQESQTSMTADPSNRRRNHRNSSNNRYHQDPPTRPQKQRIMSPDLRPEPQLKPRHHRQRQKAKSSCRAQATVFTHNGNQEAQFPTYQPPSSQMLKSHVNHPSMSQVMPPSPAAQQRQQQLHQSYQFMNQNQPTFPSDLDQNQLTFSSVTNNYQQLGSSGLPPTNKPLSMSLLNSSGLALQPTNHSSHFYNMSGHQENVLRNPLGSSMQLNGGPISNHIASSSFGTQDFQLQPQQQQQQQQILMMSSQQMSANQPNVGSVHDTARLPQHHDNSMVPPLPYSDVQQQYQASAATGRSRKEYGGQPVLGARHRSLDATAGRHQAYNRITTNTIDSSTNMQAPTSDYFDNLVPMSTFSGKEPQARIQSTRGSNQILSGRQTTPGYQDATTIQSTATQGGGGSHTQAMTQNILSLLQQEKGQLLDQIFTLNEQVNTLEHQKLKLRKSKKKLRIQLDQTKSQLLESKRRSAMMSQSQLSASDKDTNTIATNGLLAMAIADLRQKVSEIKETSATQNENHLKTLQTTMDALYKNLVMSNINSERETHFSNNANILTTAENNYTLNEQTNYQVKTASDSQAMTSHPQTDRGHHQQLNMTKKESALEECMPPSRENLTTEVDHEQDQSTSRSQTLQTAHQEYRAVMQQSPDEKQYETGTQLMQTAQSSVDQRPFAVTSHQHNERDLRALREENQKLKTELHEQAAMLEERTRAKDNETVDILHKYQTAVQKMHGRLKDVAQRFDDGEKNRQARLRKARIEMEHELGRLTLMNEQLFNSCQQFQEKYLELSEVNQGLKELNKELVQERERQGCHIVQLININKGQVALIDNIKKRLSHTEGHLLLRNNNKGLDIGTFNSGRLRRSRSSSVQIHSVRINQAFESETKINDLLSSQEEIFQPLSHLQPIKTRDDIHERSQGRQSNEMNNEEHKQETMTDVNVLNSAIQMKRETTERYTIEAMLEEGAAGKTIESQTIRRSLLEPNRSSMNHESHNDQHDYDSTIRNEIISGIPQLSPFLLSQLTKRLELESKLVDHKNFLKQHSGGGQQVPHISSQTAVVAPGDGRSIEILASPIPTKNEVVSSPSMVSPQHMQQVLFPTVEQIKQGNDGFEHFRQQITTTCSNQNMDMKRTPPFSDKAAQKIVSQMTQQLEQFSRRNDSTAQQLHSANGVEQYEENRDHKGNNGISVYSSTLHHIEQYNSSTMMGYHQNVAEPPMLQSNSAIATGGTMHKDQTRSIDVDSRPEKQQEVSSQHHNTISFQVPQHQESQDMGNQTQLPQKQAQHQLHQNNTTATNSRIQILQEALFQKTSTASSGTPSALKQEPMMHFGTQDSKTASGAVNLPTQKQQQKQPHRFQTKTAATAGVARQESTNQQFWNLKQIVSLDSSILTEAHSSLNASLMREKHEKMSQDYEQLQGSQEVLLTKIKDEIGNLDQEIIVLQRNLTKAINKRN